MYFGLVALQMLMSSKQLADFSEVSALIKILFCSGATLKSNQALQQKSLFYSCLYDTLLYQLYSGLIIDDKIREEKMLL